MNKKCLTSKNGSPAAGPYSPAVAVGEMLFVSGQGPFAHDGSGPVRGSIEEETRLTLKNLQAVLEDNASSMTQVVKTTCFLADMAHFGQFNAVYQEFFPQDCPARTCIQAAKLPAGIQVEIEAIAIIGS